MLPIVETQNEQPRRSAFRTRPFRTSTSLDSTWLFRDGADEFRGRFAHVASVKCPTCGAKTEAPRSQPGGSVTLRLRACPCGFRGTSEERWLKSTFHSAGTVPAHVPATARTVPAAKKGFGVSALSDLPSLPILSASDPDPTSVVSTLESKRKGRPSAHDYPPEFSALWDGIKPPPRGLKFKAYRAWVKCKPDAISSIRVFTLWRGTDSWRRGFEPHLSTWLNGRGWETEPTAAELRAPAANGAGARESFEAIREREASERLARTQDDIESQVAATSAKFSRCARHLYNRNWGDCNPRCPEWKGKAAVG